MMTNNEWMSRWEEEHRRAFVLAKRKLMQRDWSFLWAVPFLWPWLLGLADVAVWAVLGHQLTDIPWGELRGAVLVLWPVFFALIAIAIGP